MRPAVVRRARRLAGRVLRRLQGGPAAAHGEKPQSFYDDAFEHVESYHVHYTRSEYYAVWTVVIAAASCADTVTSRPRPSGSRSRPASAMRAVDAATRPAMW